MKKMSWMSMVLLVVCVTGVWGDNWAQYLGPNRNATSPETGLLRQWPETGPKVDWSFPLGPGYGAPAVYEGKVYLLDRVDAKQDVLRCIDLKTGKEEWNLPYEAEGRFSHPGSRSVPAVNADRIFTCGPHGDLYCVDRNTHKPLWNKHIRDGFGEGGRLGWGFGQNPLLYKDLLIVAPMTSQVGVVALDQKTGDVRWTSPPLTGNPSYVSPTLLTLDGEKQIVMVSAVNSGRRGRRNRSGDAPAETKIDESQLGSVVGLNPDSGKLLWKYTGWQCKIPIPNVVSIGDGRLFIAGGYGAGSAMFQVQKQGGSYSVKELYKTGDFGAHCHPPVLYKDHLYGHFTTNSRRDGMICMTLDGKVLWKTGRDPVFDKGGFILADGLILSVDGRAGDLYLIEPSPQGFKPLAKARLLEPGEIWAPLTLADGKLLIRDQTQLKCVQVR